MMATQATQTSKLNKKTFERDPVTEKQASTCIICVVWAQGAFL